MTHITDLAQQPAVRAALAGYHARLDDIVAQIVAIQQVPAPTFDEARRAEYMTAQFRAAGVTDVERDALHNVFARLPGRDAGRPPLVVSAHLDTVFPATTDLTTRREGALLYGPGIGDNSTGLAGLLVLARTLVGRGLRHDADIYLVANVGEEGLGDLRGMRAVVERFGGRAVYVVVEGGLFGQLTHQAIGVRRYRIEVTAPGAAAFASGLVARSRTGRSRSATKTCHWRRRSRATSTAPVPKIGSRTSSSSQAGSAKCIGLGRGRGIEGQNHGGREGC